MKIIINDQLSGPLLKYSKSFTSTFNWITAEVAKELADYTKNNYLLGQKFNRRTGQLYKSLKFYKTKDLKMGVRPGVGVRGNLNYLNKWNGTSREFMKPSLQRFESGRMPDKIMQSLVQRNIKRSGF